MLDPIKPGVPRQNKILKKIIINFLFDAFGPIG
jgi:hypothetical protein